MRLAATKAAKPSPCSIARIFALWRKDMNVTNTDFSGFGLADPILRALKEAGYQTPTPIQTQAIPLQMAGRDMLGIAQTGTGKTASFGLPLLHHLAAENRRPKPRAARALILAPTRELAVQIEESLRTYGRKLRMRIVLVLGGVPRGKQIRALEGGADIVIATPGRLTDLIGERKVRFDEATHLVLDEADRMLDMGFVRDVKKIAAGMPKSRQTVLFSATMPKEIEALAADLLNDPAKVEVAPQGTTVGAIEQRIVFTPAQRKRDELAALLGDPACERVIVFARTKHGADRVVQNLGKDGFRADAIHGNKAQNARQRALNDFKTGRVKVLVATDIAARGIDVTGITHVINYDLPDEAENYTHRIGRTGRNGADGVAVTLCDPVAEKDKLRAVEKLIRLRLTPNGTEPLPEREARPAPKSGKPAGGRRRRRRSGGGGMKRAA